MAIVLQTMREWLVWPNVHEVPIPAWWLCALTRLQFTGKFYPDTITRPQN